MGVSGRYLGPECPSETFLWQDNVPKGSPLSSDDVTNIKKAIEDANMNVKDLVHAAWSSAATFRTTDLRGGANGARIRLAPQKNWAVNNPTSLGPDFATYEKIQAEFNAAHTQQVSM